MLDALISLILTATEQRNINRLRDISGVPIYIYGTGPFARDVFRAATNKCLHISAFLDLLESKPPLIAGIPVLGPDASHSGIVFIGVHNRNADLQSIISRLHNCGAKRIIAPVELFDFFGDALGSRYWLDDRAFYASCISDIKEAYLQLRDDTSRALYLSILKFRITGDCSALPKPDWDHQYFPQDIPAWKTPLRFVDGGAFHGDTIAAFIRNGFAMDAIAAFEPDPLNFEKLTQYASVNIPNISNIALFPCAVSHAITQMVFDTNCGEGSCISSKGNSIVQCVALDNVIPTFAPNLIKLDIEGAEYDALRCATRLIRTFARGLAISIYHHPEHLWRLLLLVKEIAPGKYNYYIRMHAMSSFETILYCIPIF